VAKKKTALSAKKPVTAKPAKELAGVFTALKEILEPYEKDLHVLPYKPEYYCLVTRPCRFTKESPCGLRPFVWARTT
jgi:hypothetical protein